MHRITFGVMIIIMPVLFCRAQPVATVPSGAQQEVVRIQNAAEPEYATPTVTLTKVWEVGGENPGFIINNPVALDVDTAGRIYVLDALESDVKVFAADGRFLYKFGQKGQGPGDLLAPLSLAVLTALNQILIIDHTGQRRFNFFDLQGHYLHSFQDTLLKQETIAANERTALSEQRTIHSGTLFRTPALLVLTNDLEALKYQVRELWWYDYKAMKTTHIVKIKRPDPVGFNNGQIYERMESEPQYGVDPAGALYVVQDNYTYDIQVYDSTGQLTRTIQRAFTLPRKSAAEYQKDLERHQKDMKFWQGLGTEIQIKTLRDKPIIYGPHMITRSLFTDAQHRLWVLTNEPYPPHQSRSLVDQVLGLFRHDANASDAPHTRLSFDVFSPAGKYLMKIPFDANQPRCFRYKDGYLYYLALKEDGFPWLFKYRIVG